MRGCIKVGCLFPVRLDWLCVYRASRLGSRSGSFLIEYLGLAEVQMRCRLSSNVCVLLGVELGQTGQGST